jgi:hypothetical protein
MRTAALTIGLLMVFLGLGTMDAVLTGETGPVAALFGAEPTEVAVQPEPENPVPEEVVPTENPEPAPVGGVRKVEGPDVGAVLGQLQFEAQAIGEPIFLSRIIPPEDGTTVTGAVLLKEGDRAGVLAWADSPKIKLYFLALKEALHESFTPAVRDLVDETQRREGKPTRNFLSFTDPGISEERIVFVRVRERLYEVHIAEGKDELMFGLIDALSD